MKQLILFGFITSLALCVALSLISCSTSTMGTRMTRRIGRPIDEVVLAQGNPSKVEKTPSGGFIYVWLHSRKTQEVTLTCNVKYLTDKDGIIMSWHYDGNNCG